MRYASRSNELFIKDELTPTPKAFEEWGQATVEDLKQINLHIFISVSLDVVEEVHSWICGSHRSGPKLHFRIKRLGYYWLTMVKDCMSFSKRCQAY